MNWIIFLDRDWVINKKAKDHKYITKWWDFVFNNKVKDFIAYCNNNDLKVIVVTNQQWIWKWLYTIGDLDYIHKNLNKDLTSIWAKIDDFYFCPHLVSDSCNCRKPNIGMLERACFDLNYFDKNKMFFIWDSDSDIACANNFWIKSYKIESDKFEENCDEIIKTIEKLFYLELW